MEAIKQTAITVGDHRALRTDNTQAFGRNGDDGRKRTGNPTGDTRNYRTTDSWLTSLDEAITQNQQQAQDAQAYADYLETMRDAGGLLTDPEGEPVALWTSLKGFSGAHYACFPVALVLDLIRGATSEAGVCSHKIKKLVIRRDLSPEEESKVRLFLTKKKLI